MKRLLLVFLLMTFALTVHTHVTKRDESDEDDSDKNDEEEEGGLKGLMLKTKDMSMKVPLVGELTGDTIGKLIDGYEQLQRITDGTVGRILGGAFPCTISLDSFACTGHTTDQSVSTIVKTLLESLPSVIMPSILRTSIILMIQLFVEPTIDVFFGGIAKPEAMQA